MADDDIIDLVEVVKPGSSTPLSAEGAPLAPPVPKAASAPSASGVQDFGADLDALLNDFGGNSSPSASTPTPVTGNTNFPEGAAGVAPPVIAAPIANPVKSDREVNANEEIDLPPLSDLDALLEELGVQDSPQSEARQSVNLGMNDLDAMPLPGTGQSAAQTQVAASPASLPETASDDIDMAALAAGVAAAKNPAPASRASDFAEELTAARAAAAATPGSSSTAPGAQPVPDSTRDFASASEDLTSGIDMNELDALLDTVLAAAPKSAPKNQAQAVNPSPGANPTATAPPASAVAPAPMQAEPELIASADLDEFLEMSAAAQAGLSVPDLAELAALRLEVDALRAELTDLRSNMEKYAASAAAKVIREEISSLSKHL